MKESEVESFNLPFYKPNEGEVREIVQNEGSFEINKIDTYELLVYNKSDEEEDDDDQSSHGIEVGKKKANVTRSITEPMLLAHFGDTNIINHIFDKFAHHATQDYARFPDQTTFNIIISLIRK